jgi:hypothetical protein
MVDLTRIVSVVEIEDVRLCEASCRSLARPSDLAETIAVMPLHGASVIREPGDDGLLLIHTDFSLEIRSEDHDGELQAEIRGLFELSYRIPKEERFSSDVFKEFGQFNAIFNAWPYWRELVQASLARMSMPVLTVPVYRVSPRKPVKDNEE